MSITTAFRVSGFLRLCDLEGDPAYVLKKGDETAGAVLVKHARRDGMAAVYARRYDLDGSIVWEMATGDVPVSDAQADAYIERRIRSDPDLWAIEVESRKDSLCLSSL